jgi:hypothetical protein
MEKDWPDERSEVSALSHAFSHLNHEMPRDEYEVPPLCLVPCLSCFLPPHINFLDNKYVQWSWWWW